MGTSILFLKGNFVGTGPLYIDLVVFLPIRLRSCGPTIPGPVPGGPTVPGPWSQAHGPGPMVPSPHAHGPTEAHGPGPTVPAVPGLRSQTVLGLRSWAHALSQVQVEPCPCSRCAMSLFQVGPYGGVKNLKVACGHNLMPRRA